MHTIHPVVYSLFEQTCARITEQHIIAFAPCDPGCESYVQVWTDIYLSGRIPPKTAFDLSEVINLTGWANATDFIEPERFRDFRRFTTAVAVALINMGNDAELVRVGNYLARDLLLDASVSSREHFDLVREVSLLMRSRLASARDSEFPFFTLTALILSQQAEDYAASAAMASVLIQDEAAARHDAMSVGAALSNNRFLLGLTNFNQLHAEWIQLGQTLVNPYGDEDLQLVIDAFAGGT